MGVFDSLWLVGLQKKETKKALNVAAYVTDPHKFQKGEELKLYRVHTINFDLARGNIFSLQNIRAINPSLLSLGHNSLPISKI